MQAQKKVKRLYFKKRNCFEKEGLRHKKEQRESVVECVWTGSEKSKVNQCCGFILYRGNTIKILSNICTKCVKA